MKRVTVYLTEDEYDVVKRRAGLAPLSAWFKAFAFPTTIQEQSAPVEMPTAPSPFERKDRKPLFKRPGRLL